MTPGHFGRIGDDPTWKNKNIYIYINSQNLEEMSYASKDKDTGETLIFVMC